jgi:hypothetical protein
MQILVRLISDPLFMIFTFEHHGPVTSISDWT